MNEILHFQQIDNSSDPRLIRRIAEFLDVLIFPTEPGIITDTIVRSIQDPRNRCLYLVKDNELLAAGTVDTTEGGGFELGCMAVADGHRGQGVGTVLLSRLEASALDMGCRILRVYPADDESENFFLNRGYKFSAQAQPPLSREADELYKHLARPS